MYHLVEIQDLYTGKLQRTMYDTRKEADDAIEKAIYHKNSELIRLWKLEEFYSTDIIYTKKEYDERGNLRESEDLS